MRMKVTAWARHYGVRYRKEKTGFCRYTGVLSKGGRTLRIPDLIYPFGPSLKEALRETVRAARTAAAFGGDFEAYMSRQGRTRPLRSYAREFAPGQKAYEDLLRVLGTAATRALLWEVKEFQ